MENNKSTKIQHRWRTKGILVLLIFLLSLTTVYAHRMMIDPVEDTRIWVGYEDGTTVENINIQVLNEEEEIIAEETADEEGYYSFENYPEAHSIIADDGMGHRVTWVVGEPAVYREGWGRYLRILGVLTLFILVAIYFQRKIKKKASKQERSS